MYSIENVIYVADTTTLLALNHPLMYDVGLDLDEDMEPRLAYEDPWRRNFVAVTQKDQINSNIESYMFSR